MIEKLQNIYKIPELRRKLLITLGLIALCRVGVFIPIPGIDTEVLKTYFVQFTGTGVGQLLGLVDLFAGGALASGAVFGLGVMPYISASIIFQLLVGVVPALERLNKEGDAGRKKINQYTRMTTVCLCMFQAFILTRTLYTIEINNVPVVPVYLQGMGFQLMAALLLTTGTMFLMWIGEQIDEFGIGSGISIVIMVGIVDRLPWAFSQIVSNFTFSVAPAEHQIGIFKLLMLIASFLAIVAGVVYITQGQRRIPVQQAKHTRGRKVYGGQKHFLPLRVNQAGVMPIIFAQSLLIFPTAILQGLQVRFEPNSLGYWMTSRLTEALQGGIVYVSLYCFLIAFFCYFWTAIQFNPKDMSDNMKDYGSFIPGIRPGGRTADYLENVMSRITLAGAAFLAIIALLPMVMTRGFEVSRAIAGFYGGTGLLIVVGVALDMLQKIEAHLTMRHYSGLLGGTGRIRGRRG
ncbi:MAG: preprotein translocase subunit SecY [Candidatus Brocadiales bacterium]|nr:preprotein translocase subunit SecY [Candidatus Bathyanammoxibius amoris]